MPHSPMNTPVNLTMREKQKLYRRLTLITGPPTDLDIPSQFFRVHQFPSHISLGEILTLFSILVKINNRVSCCLNKIFFLFRVQRIKIIAIQAREIPIQFSLLKCSLYNIKLKIEESKIPTSGGNAQWGNVGKIRSMVLAVYLNNEIIK